LEEKRGETLEKKEGVSERNRGNWKEGFGGLFVKIYMNPSNLIYVIIIFLKLKIY